MAKSNQRATTTSRISPDYGRFYEDPLDQLIAETLDGMKNLRDTARRCGKTPPASLADAIEALELWLTGSKMFRGKREKRAAPQLPGQMELVKDLGDVEPSRAPLINL